MLTFQQIILKLNQYWDRHGCVLLQPYDMEMGAGTFHTATFLRAIGPEPWNAAYVQPSRRPKDGRYGENPNRLQHYYQYQVVMKPSPAKFQDLYLGSLHDALGIFLPLIVTNCLVLARAEHQRARVGAARVEQGGEIVGQVLAVGVQGHDDVGAELQGDVVADAQRHPAAAPDR